MNTETRAKEYASILLTHIRKEGGIFLKRNDTYSLLLGSSQIKLDLDPSNIALAGLLIKYLDVGSLTPTARATIQRLQVQAADEARNCMYSDSSCFYDDAVFISLDRTTLAVVTSDEISTIPNGSTFPTGAPSRVLIGHTSDWCLGRSDVQPATSEDFSNFERL